RDTGIAIDDRGNLAVRTNLDELRLELIAVANVHRMYRVLEAALFEHDGGFASVGRRPGVEIDHRSISFRRGVTTRFVSYRRIAAHHICCCALVRRMRWRDNDGIPALIEENCHAKCR